MDDGSGPDRMTVRMDIGLASLSGFVIRDAGTVLAAFTTCAEMCRWIEEHWSQFDPPREQEEPPNVLKMEQPRGWGGRLKGK